MEMPTQEEWNRIADGYGYLTPEDVVKCLERYRAMCERLQACAQKHHLLPDGSLIDERVIKELERYKRAHAAFLDAVMK